jgi:hypothetical protein
MSSDLATQSVDRRQIHLIGTRRRGRAAMRGQAAQTREIGNDFVILPPLMAAVPFR